MDSPYINEVDVVPPSPQLDTYPDFTLATSLGSPSFRDGSYYSPFSNHSELSFVGEHDLNLNIFDDTNTHIHTDYDPTDYDPPNTSSSLLVYHDHDYMSHYTIHDNASPSSDTNPNDERTTDRQSRASSVSSNHPNTYSASPRLEVVQSFEAMSFRSPGFPTESLPSASHSPVPPSQSLSPPRLLMPDDQPQDSQGLPKIKAPDPDNGMGGLLLNIVPATPIGAGDSAANPVSFQTTLHHNSTLGLQLQPWSTATSHPSASPTSQASNLVPKQEFTFPSQGSLFGDYAPSASLNSQTVDDSAVPGSNSLFIPPRTRSKSDTSHEQLPWAQPYPASQPHLGTLGGTTVVDEQTVNVNDVPSATQQPQLNPEFTFGGKPSNNFLSPDNPSSIRRVKSEGVSTRPMHRQSRSEDVRGIGLPSSLPGHQHSQSSSGQFLSPPPTGQRSFLSPSPSTFFSSSTAPPPPPPPPNGHLPPIRGGRSTSPVRPSDSNPGHMRRASSGTRSERGSEAWPGGPPLAPHRVSPYPSPHASPRPPINDLPFDDYSIRSSLLGVGFSQPQAAFHTGYVPGAYTPSSAGGSVYHTPGQSPSPAPQLTVDSSVPKPTVTTGRTANASHKRRKQDATFVCPIPGCGSTFTRSFNLKGHIRSHNDEKPFMCPYPECGKGFARQHDCKRHQQLHLETRPHECNGCGKQFARMDALNRHLRSEGGANCRESLRDNSQGHDQGSGRVKSEMVPGVMNSSGMTVKSAAIAL